MLSIFVLKLSLNTLSAKGYSQKNELGVAINFKTIDEILVLYIRPKGGFGVRNISEDIEEYLV